MTAVAFAALVTLRPSLSCHPLLSSYRCSQRGAVRGQEGAVRLAVGECELACPLAHSQSRWHRHSHSYSHLHTYSHSHTDKHSHTLALTLTCIVQQSVWQLNFCGQADTAAQWDKWNLWIYTVGQDEEKSGQRERRADRQADRQTSGQTDRRTGSCRAANKKVLMDCNMHCTNCILQQGGGGAAESGGELAWHMAKTGRSALAKCNGQWIAAS